MVEDYSNNHIEMTKSRKQSLEKITRKYNLELVILFGSTARGKERAESDADVAVKSMTKLDFRKQLRLAGDLRDVFNREVDLSLVEYANPLLLHQICKYGKLVYGSGRVFSGLKLYAFHRYNDYAPYFRMEEQLVKQGVALNQ